MTSLLLTLSLSCNLILTILIASVLQGEKVLNLIRKILVKLNLKANNSSNYSPFYFHRLSQLSSLPVTEKDVVFVGDSLTNEGEWSELMKTDIKNRGISGDTTSGVLKRLNPILQGKPQKLFIMIGINDILQDVEVEEVAQNHVEILTAIHAHSPCTQVFVQSLLPVGKNLNSKNANAIASELNNRLAKAAQHFSYKYIDLAPHFSDQEGTLNPAYSQDELHLNGEGYDLWRRLIEEDVLS